MSDIQIPNGRKLPVCVEWVYTHACFKKTLEVLSSAIVALTVLTFIGGGIYLALSSWISALLYVITLFVPFVLVSILRVWIDAARPCAVYTLQNVELPHKKTSRSMPSRHVFSVFAIGASICFFHLPLGLTTLVFGIVLAGCRVLLAVHFMRDVAVGACIGALSGIISGIVIINCLF